ncbi:MAG: porin [Paraburkholderia sp.]|uniref:porin n=1 Tax=Paraburkholderia sp. TaxID=1926495 RepID=UPI001228FAD6|nr:porin [Paraburkholderia sp.]TAM05453.1 MAG: porin [Paraburkholderia sp.]TAM27885.1 MAG: porin [Paraburkholderia sp.]
MKMTTAALGASLLALSAQSAFAQSSVTLYGIVDTAIRFQTNADAANNNLIGMTVGAVTPSRWGLKGKEDLGGGLSAIFKLENQFQLWSGKLDSSSNQLFKRAAWVGLSSDEFGTLTFGRQQTPFFEEMGNTFDPLTVGDYWQDSWIYNPVGPFLYSDNSIKYAKTLGGLSVKAMYGFGNQAGSVGKDSMYGLTATYTFGPVEGIVGWQQNDAPVRTSLFNPTGAQGKWNQVNVGVVYTVVPAVRLMAGWLRSQDRTGTVDNAQVQSGDGLPLGLNPSPNRIDNNFYIGTTWQATVPLLITAVGYYGRTQNATMLNNTLGGGHNYSATLLAEYALSKRTEVYGTVDYTRGTGAYLTAYPGHNNQTGVAIGLRNIF